MGRSQESFNKKEIRNKKEKKRKDKEKKRLAKKDSDKKTGLDDMIAYVDENGMLCSTPPDLSKKVEINVEDIEINIAKKSTEEYNPIRTGTLKFFNESKGYGFIVDAETNESIFAHINEFAEELKEGNRVTFEIEMGPKGAAARKVKKH